MTSAAISYFPTRWFVNNTSSSPTCFFRYESNLEPVTYSPFWLNIFHDVSKLTIIQHTHTTQLYFTDRFYPWPFYLFSQSQQSLIKYFFFLNVQNCHLVSLTVLVPQWMLKWSKRVSLRSVSSTNYPTSHHPPIVHFYFFFYMFTNFMHHQILQYTKDTKSNTHNIYTCLSLRNSKMVKNTLGQ